MILDMKEIAWIIHLFSKSFQKRLDVAWKIMHVLEIYVEILSVVC